MKKTKHFLTVDNKFIIVTPVYNSEKYITECIDSILSQEYNNYELCVMDDCSTDGTWDHIGVMCNSRRPFNMCRNEYRIASPLANIVKAIELFALDDEDIICIVDGDDKLAHNLVFKELNEVYQNNEIWMTYGQFIPLSGKYGPYCEEIVNPENHRKNKGWKASHLKTFRKKLWDKIKDEDLRDDKGRYFKFIGDAAFIYPMVEMCENEHMRFISKVNYLYNDLNPINELTIARKEQLRLSDIIWSRPAYIKLNSL